MSTLVDTLSLCIPCNMRLYAPECKGYAPERPRSRLYAKEYQLFGLIQTR